MPENRYLSVFESIDIPRTKEPVPENWLIATSIINYFIVKDMVDKDRGQNWVGSIIESDRYQPFSDLDALTQCLRDVADINFDLMPVGRRRLYPLGEVFRQALGRDRSIIGGVNRSLLTRVSQSVKMGMEIDPTNPGIIKLAPVASFANSYRWHPLSLKVWG